MKGLRFNKLKFTKKQKNKLMGQKVIVTHVYKKFKKENSIYNRTENCIVEIEPKPAWVTGFSYIKNGLIEGQDIKEFITEETISCVKVRFSYKEKEYNIPVNGFLIPKKEVMPEANSDKHFSQQYKEFYHSNKEAYPRDDKGRFC